MIMNLQENINRVRQIMGLINEAKPKVYSLEYIKDRIADATSLNDFKEKNPQWGSMYGYIRNNYKNDPYNNWIDLTSHFNDSQIKPSLNSVKKKIEDATSWKDFKEKNPQWGSMYIYIIRNYKNDPDNNWENLISVFEDAPIKQSLEHIKRKIEDATSWKDFKEKNPKAESMYTYINVNYKNDPDNNWETLTSHFNNLKGKNFSLDYVKDKIADATSWKDFKEKNPNYLLLYNFINKKYGKNTWRDLISVFDDTPIKYSLDYIKARIADATSWKDFKEKNPKWITMSNFINNNYDKDTWQDLISVFDDDKKTKRPLDYIKARIADATSLKDFKEKNPKWRSIQQIMNDKYKDDPENNWKKLTSHFVK
jgi:hypothetical protein